MPRYAIRRHLRNFLQHALWLVPCWILAIFIFARVVFGTDTPATLAEEWIRSILLGTSIGLLGAALETWILPRLTQRIPFTVALLVRTVLYSILVILCVLAGIVRVMLLEETQQDPGAVEIEPTEILTILTSPESIAVSLILVGVSFLLSLVLQVNRVLGPGTLVALFLGKYVRPQHEERIFLFLDITDSTSIAEELGPLKFSDFKNNFFHDVAGPILATRGEIYQYVGDEVVVTWPFAIGKSNGNCLRLFFLIDDVIRSRKSIYLTRYGIVPKFKAGLHGGPVVTAEIGSLKRTIVHSGDTLNTTARIEGQCRPLGHRLLVSRSLLWQCALPEGLTTTEVGEVSLRGKSESVILVAVERAGL